MWYNFNINNFVSNYIWKSARKPKLIDYCQSLLKPISVNHNEIFPKFYDDVTDRSKWTGQVLVLEDILNETYGYTFSTTGTNSIYIQQFDQEIDDYFFYNQSELFSGVTRPKYMGNQSEGDPFLYLYNQQEIERSFDFEVYMPTAAPDDSKLKNIVNNLKMAATNYVVVRY